MGSNTGRDKVAYSWISPNPAKAGPTLGVAVVVVWILNSPLKKIFSFFLTQKDYRQTNHIIPLTCTPSCHSSSAGDQSTIFSSKHNHYHHHHQLIAAHNYPNPCEPFVLSDYWPNKNMYWKKRK